MSKDRSPCGSRRTTMGTRGMCNSLVAFCRHGSMQPMSCTKEVVLPVDADEAWEAVSDETALEAWLAERVELDLRPGGDASFVLPDGEERRGMVEEGVPGERPPFWGGAGGGAAVRGGGRRRGRRELARDVRARPGRRRHARPRHRDAGRADRAGDAVAARARIRLTMSDVFAALGDATRRTVYERVAAGSTTATQLAAELPVTR